MRRNDHLTDRAFEFETHELIDFGGEFERQLVKDLPTEATDDHSDSLFQIDAALLEVEQLIFADLGSARFVFDLCRWLPHLHKRATARPVVSNGIALGYRDRYWLLLCPLTA